MNTQTLYKAAVIHHSSPWHETNV